MTFKLYINQIYYAPEMWDKVQEMVVQTDSFCTENLFKQLLLIGHNL